MNLDDVTQSVVYIPYKQPDDADPPSSIYNPFEGRDLPGGYALRMEAYRAAWSKCLNQVQTIMKDIHEPVVDSVVRQVHSAYSDALPGLPYCEMPVITVTGGAALLHGITKRLEDSDATDTFVTHLYPGEKPNILTCMKSLITGFVDRPPDQSTEQPKRKPSASLAVYDIELLEAWYAVACNTSEDPPQLVVLLHNFEQFDPTVIQDLFYICSLHVPRLPLVFVLSLSAPPPPSPSYLHLMYPRSTLALLRVQNVTVPSGMRMLEEIIRRTFFDVEFEPDIVLGPAALDFTVDFFQRHDASLDALITVLHLAHLKHFDDPLTILVQSSILPLLSPPSSASYPFLSRLLTRLHSPSPNSPPSASHASDWRAATPAALLESIDGARAAFRRAARRRRVGVGLMRAVKRWLRGRGWKTTAENAGRRGGGKEAEEAVDMMCRVLRGRLGREGRWLGSMVKKLKPEQLPPLLAEIHTFFHGLPSHVRMEEEVARAQIVTFISALPADDKDDNEEARRLAEAVGEWLAGYFQDNLTSLEEGKLWDIWYTGSTPFPSELINPSVRASIVSGLLHPLDYATANSTPDLRKENEPPELWELPDTSILFRRYLDSGKMINVYDWFESFVVVLENQREHARKRKKNTKSKPRAGASPRKGKQRQLQEVDEQEGEDDEDDEDGEKWKLEIQARFMRALHELDYLGFIKHTGRKADHVLRTVFDIVD